MQTPFYLHVLETFQGLAETHGLRPAIQDNDMVYLVSPRGYALGISNDRDGINIMYLRLRARDDILSYNLPLAIARNRKQQIPRSEMRLPEVSTTDKLRNYALMLLHGAPDALAGDTTWLDQVANPIPWSPTTRAALYDFLQGALRAPLDRS